MANQMFSNILVVPAIAGALCLILPRVKWIKEIIAFLAAAYTFYLSFALYPLGEVRASFFTLNLGGFELPFVFRGYPLSSLLVIFASFFVTIIVLYSWSFMAGKRGLHIYYAFSLWTLAAANGVLLSDNLFFLLIFWEILTALLFFLIGLGGNNKARAGMGKAFVILGFTDACMLLGVVLVALKYGNLSLSTLKIPVSDTTSTVMYLLFLAAAMAKAGAMPLHSWIPTAAEGAPTPVLALLPASLDKLLGIYLLARISLDIFQLNGGLKTVLLVIGGVTVLAAVGMAMVQHELKKLLAFHAISQVGYMVLGIGTGVTAGIVGGLFHMINNAIYKSGLFLSAGSVEKRAETTELDQVGGLARYMPFTFITMTIFAFSISGIPPFNGFASKWLVYQGLVETHQTVWLVVAVFGSALTLASFIKVLASIFTGKKPEGLPGKITDVPISMKIPSLLLAVLCIFFGVFASYPVYKLILPALGYSTNISITAPLMLGMGFYSSTLATVLIIVGIFIGLLIYAILRTGKMKVVEPFFYGEKFPYSYSPLTKEPDSVRFPGTEYYKTVEKLGILKGVYRDAKRGVFDLYNYLGFLGQSLFVRPMKLMHTGVLSTYLSWCIIGVVAILITVLTP